MASNFEELQNKLLRWTKVDPLIPSSRHTTSLSTRRPSFYDLHMPSLLQPNKISFGKPESTLGDEEADSTEDRYFKRLFVRERSVKALQGTPAEEWENNWTKILRRIGTTIVVRNEDGVVKAQEQALDVVFPLVCLALFNLTDKQIERLDDWQILIANTSIEQDTKADIIISLLPQEKIMRWDNLMNGKCEPIWPLVENLEAEYMDCINSKECKNILLGNPLAYLTFLSLIRLTECGEVVDFWVETDCKGCSEFRNSHDMHRNHLEWDLPLDSSHPFGLAASSDLQVINLEIIRVLRILSSLSDFVPEVTGDKTDRPKSRDPWASTVEPYMRKLWNVDLQPSINNAGLQVPSLDEIMRWVPRCWAQMRVRNSSQAIISPFDHVEADGYIIRQASWIIDAWEDAKERSQIESSLGMAPWSDIFAPNAAPKVDLDYERAPSHDPDEGDHDSDGNYLPLEDEGMVGGNQKQMRSRKPKQKKSTHPPGSDTHNRGQGGDGGSGGGAGGGAGGGSAGSSGGTNSSGKSTGSGALPQNAAVTLPPDLPRTLTKEPANIRTFRFGLSTVISFAFLGSTSGIQLPWHASGFKRLQPLYKDFATDHFGACRKSSGSSSTIFENENSQSIQTIIGFNQ
ncbi:hypothetical protein BT96DRAFT_981952, partial [Gymnopus androsaceus JB14]